MGGLRQDDFFTIETRLFYVDQAIERRIFFAGNALTGVEHCVKCFLAVIGKSIPLLQLVNF